MGPDALDGPDPQDCPPQGGPSNCGAKSVVMNWWGVVLSTPGRGYVGGGAGDD